MTTTEDFALCRAYKSAAMPVHGFYYSHPACWDTRETPGPEVTSLEVLYEGETPIEGGYVRLIPLAEIAIDATCCYCQKPLARE